LGSGGSSATTRNLMQTSDVAGHGTPPSATPVHTTPHHDTPPSATPVHNTPDNTAPSEHHSSP
jgi:hypothetical protein